MLLSFLDRCPVVSHHNPLRERKCVDKTIVANVTSLLALQHAQAQASLNQQMLRNQMPHHVNGLGQHHTLQSRLPNPQNNPMQHLVIGNNNNNYKQGLQFFFLHFLKFASDTFIFLLV